MAEETMTALAALMREQNGIAQGTSKSIHDIVEITRSQNEKSNNNERRKMVKQDAQQDKQGKAHCKYSKRRP